MSGRVNRVKRFASLKPVPDSHAYESQNRIRKGRGTDFFFFSFKRTFGHPKVKTIRERATYDVLPACGASIRTG